MNCVKIILCEGPHDTAFISRILRVYGCKNEKTAVGDLPLSLKNFLINQYQPNIESFPLYDVRSNILTPNYVLNDGHDTIFILYNLGGDTKTQKRRELLDAFINLFRSEMSGPIETGFSLQVIFEYDADKHGRQRRVDDINSELATMMPSCPALSHGARIEYGNIIWGVYIFASPESDKGRLEDMVLPMMQEGNDDIFADIGTIVNNRNLYSVCKTIKPKDDSWDEEKAMIGIAGQVHKSGMANAAIIEQSCFITPDKILNNAECQKIAAFLLG